MRRLPAVVELGVAVAFVGVLGMVGGAGIENRSMFRTGVVMVGMASLWVTFVVAIWIDRASRNDA